MRCFCILLFASAVFAQGTEPKPKPEDYPVQAQATVMGQPVAVGSEFMVHSFSRGEESYIAPQFLVVEVALYPAKGAKLTVSPSQFSLRINGKKQVLQPQSPQLVAASISHPEWQGGGPRLDVGGGVGGIGVGNGRQRPMGMPGQTDPSRDPNAPEQKPRIKPEQLAVETGLPFGETQKPVSGYLYFSYKGKSSSIKSLELLYEDTPVKLR